MRKVVTLKNVLGAAIVFLLIAQGVTWYLLGKANREINDTKQVNQTIFNDLDGSMRQSSLSPIPGKKRLYLAELNLSVPLNQTTSSVRYTFTDGPSTADNGEARLTSTYMTDHTSHVKSCSDMVRLKVEAQPNAYSPDQPHYATVKLADGRTLQIYASTTPECEFAWVMLSPQKLAEAFKEATSY